MFFSCKNSNVENQQLYQSNNTTFRHYLKKFKPVELPFTYTDNYAGKSVDMDQLFSLDNKSNDTLFLKSDYLEEIKCLGMLPDTSEFFALIYLYPAEDYYPQIVTYDKKGTIIDEASLLAVGCGSDCGLSSCSQIAMINKNLSIFCADTLIWEHMCDSLGQVIPNSSQIWINTKSGQISNKGKLMLEKKSIIKKT